MNDGLIETLREAQRFGFFGPGPVERAAQHALAYVEAIGDLAPGTRIVDLGSGGGLPGLVLADAYRDAEVVLVDRRTKRTDFLRRAVLRLRFDHVQVLAGDVDELVRHVRIGAADPFDVATARGFGPPEVTLRSACGLLRAGGRAIISEPPEGERWPPKLLEELGVVGNRRGSVRVFQRFT